MAILYCWSGAAGTATGASWANAKTTLVAAFTTEVAGDTIYVAHDHAESTAATITMVSSGTGGNPTKIVCVDRGGTVPPVSADRRTTATVTATGAGSNINFQGTAHYDGIIFVAGSAATQNGIVVNNANVVNNRFDNCSLRLGGTSTASIITFNGPANNGSYVELNNTTLSFANAAQYIEPNGKIRWRNTSSALLGTAPTILFNLPNGSSVDLECVGVDLSAMGSGKTICGTIGFGRVGSFRFVDCKLNASVTKSTVPESTGARTIDFVRSGSAGVNYTVYSHRYAGTLIEETTITRTGGASDGVTPLSWKVVSTAECNYSLPFECPPIAIWCDTTGVSKTATIECIGTAIGTDKEVWLDLEYLSDASSPQGTFVSDSADILATAANQTTSTETWGGVLTGKFKLAVTFTPQQKGWVYCRVRCAKASSTFYIDPLVTLT